MPRSSAADAAATARRILSAATGAFAAHGFADASVDDIARSADVTRGAVYHHFGSKRGLFDAVAAALQSDVAAAVVGAADAAGEDPRAQLIAGSHAFVDAITEGEAARVLLVEAPAVMGWSAWRALDDAASGVHLLEALRACGIGAEEAEEAEALARQLSGAMNEAALWSVERGGGDAVRTRAHAALERLLAAIA